MRKLATIFFIFIFHIGFSASAKDYTVGVEDLPYMPLFENVNGEYKGYARDLLDAFSEASGHKFIYRPLPLKRLVANFFDEKIDFKYPDNPMWTQHIRKNRTVYYSDTTVISVDGVMVLPEAKGRGLDSLKILGIVLGFSPFENYLNAAKAGKLSIKEISSLESLLSVTMMGRVDGAYVNVDVAKYRLEKMGKANALIHDETLPTSRSQFLLSSIRYKDVIEEFNQFLKKEPQLVARLKAKYNIK